MTDGLLDLFGPDEPSERGRSRARRERLSAVVEQVEKLPVNKEEKTMGDLFGLFDPSLEDETTSDIDSLNNDCLSACYKSTNQKRSPTKPQHSKKKKKNSSNFSSALASDINSNVLNGIDTSDSRSATLNNAVNGSNSSKPNTINMLDKYNDWATRKQAKCAVLSTAGKGPNSSDDQGSGCNVSQASGLDKEGQSYFKASRRKSKAGKKNKIRGSLKMSPALVSTKGMSPNDLNRNGTNTQMEGNHEVQRSQSNCIENASYSASAQSNSKLNKHVKCCNIENDQLLKSKKCNNKNFIEIVRRSCSCPSSCSSTGHCSKNTKDSGNAIDNKNYRNGLCNRRCTTGACSSTQHLDTCNIEKTCYKSSNVSMQSCCFCKENKLNWVNVVDGNSNVTNADIDCRQYKGTTEEESDIEETGQPAMPDQLPSEPQEGNIEYKLKLIDPNQERFKRLVSQMQWRLREGLGEAIYEIGVEDSGLLLGLTPEELSLSMVTLRRMARQLGASLTVIREKSIADAGRKVAEVLVRKVPDDQYSIELRIAVLGSSDVGKSTLLGVLTRGQLDNGRGCARLNVFRHRHEVYSGKTSSISIQTMGFDSHGNVVDGTCTRSRDYDDEDICSQSSKIVNFIDLAGDQRYIHTTAFGLSGYCPHYVVLVVSAFSGLSAMAEEHLSLARAVDLPLLLVVTKTDLATPLQLAHTLAALRAALTAPPLKKLPLVVATVDDAITAGSGGGQDAVVPIFLVSSVTGEGLDLLKQFLFVLPPKMTAKEREKSEQDVAQFQVDEVFHVEERVVVGGLLTSGVIPHGATLMLGPFDTCEFRAVTVESIHRHKVPCRVVCAGQSASLCLAGVDTAPVRKGMKLLAPETKPFASYYFQARIRVVSGECGVGRGCELTAHIGNVRQTVVVVGVLGRERIRATDEQPASVLLRFLRQPEYVSVGARLLLRQGAVQGVGQLQQVFTEPPFTVLKLR